MSTIAVVAGTGNMIFDRVLRGIYGSATAGPTPDTVVFRPAPEFTRVSPHLFSQMPQLPVRACDIKNREVDDGEADLAKAQMLFGLGARWASLYSANTKAPEGGALDFGALMLAGEAGAVAAGVREHLTSLGMQVWEVPILVQGEVLSHGSYLTGAAAMIEHMARADRAVDLDPSRVPRQMGTTALTGQADALKRAREEAGALAAPAPAVPPQSPMRAWLNSFLGGIGATVGTQVPEVQEATGAAESTGTPAQIGPDTWTNYQGVAATIRASVYLVAPNAQAIPQALRYMLDAYREDAAGLHLEPGEIVEVRDLQRSDLALSDFEDSDFPDSGYGDRG